MLAGALGGRLSYFSALRPFTELWVALRFAALTQYHDTFRSCNRAFHLDQALRLDHWCGRCDKCCFIDLILAPFIPAADLEKIFDGREPLADPDPADSLASKFRALLGHPARQQALGVRGRGGRVPGRRAARRAAARPRRDRAARSSSPSRSAGLPDLHDAAQLLLPVGEHFIPDSYAPEDLLV